MDSEKVFFVGLLFPFLAIKLAIFEGFDQMSELRSNVRIEEKRGNSFEMLMIALTKQRGC